MDGSFLTTDIYFHGPESTWKNSIKPLYRKQMVKNTCFKKHKSKILSFELHVLSFNATVLFTELFEIEK